MATSNIRIAGATYPDVPSVTLKDTSNNDVSFVLTTDATASADKIEQGYTAYVNGQKIVGTSSGGGGTDTSQANASNAFILEGTYAYVDGDRIEGQYSSNLITQTQGEGFPSTPVAQGYYPTISTETHFSFEDSMSLSGSRYSYDITGWASSLENGTKYGLTVYFHDSNNSFNYGNYYCFVGGTTLPIKLKATREDYDEDRNVVYSHIDFYITDSLIYTDDLSSYNDIVCSMVVDDIPYSGFSQVWVEPYTLVEKTATPSTQTQVIRSSTTTNDILKIDADPISTMSGATYSVSSTYLRVNYATSIGLTAGQTYRFNARFRRQSDGVTYVFNALVKIVNAFSSVRLYLYDPTHTTSFRLTIKSSQAELTCSDSTANKTASGFYLEISEENIEADALGQVTVNPIPSEYVIPTGTISITQNGTTDVSAYQYANVNVSASTTLQSKTATPTTSSQTITADTGYDGLSQVTVNPIPNNFVDTTDSTASATDIVSGATAYVNGSKITGTLVVQSYYEGSGEPSSSLGNNGDIYFDIS